MLANYNFFSIVMSFYFFVVVVEMKRTEQNRLTLKVDKEFID